MIKYKNEEVNASFIQTSSDEKLAEVREVLIQIVINNNGTLHIPYWMVLLALVCMYFSFKVVLVVLGLIFVCSLFLYFTAMWNMKRSIKSIDEELARRKTAN